MWPIFVELRSATLEIRRRKKEQRRRKKKETLVKYKSADNYVGRPNKWLNNFFLNYRKWVVLKVAIQHVA